ncbi:MAG: DUF1538 domain-containing protein [Proteobacteria bacterium]|nr:DUF1538 domain-containing protein [Pseudomonadota bacterium]
MTKRFPVVRLLASLLRLVLGTIRDIAPIVLVIAFFQLVVLERPFPNLEEIIVGLFFVVVGLALFIKGLEMGLFPIGESLAQDFARRGNIWWLLLFAFVLGFGTTIAEPALLAITREAARMAASAGVIEPNDAAIGAYADGLRYTVAGAVGVAIVIGVLRILKGWPLHWLIIGGYVIVVAITYVAPDEIIGIAYDAGGVTTSTITVPLVTALGIGFATVIRGRNPMSDGFGMIALAVLTPVIFVMLFGILF